MNIDDMASAIEDLQRKVRDLQAQAGAGSTTVSRGVFRVAPGGGLNIEGQSNFSGRADFVGDVNFSGPTTLAGDTFVANFFSGTQWITPTGSNFTQPATFNGRLYILGGAEFANLSEVPDATQYNIAMIDPSTGELKLGPPYIAGTGGGAGGTTFQAPFDWGLVTDEYGPRPGIGKGFHDGIDFGLYPITTGTPVIAAGSGVVSTKVIHSDGGPYAFRIEHGGNIATEYWHLNARYVSAGQAVTKGQVIGEVGNLGLSYGAHLHWETWVNNATMNPRDFISIYANG